MIRQSPITHYALRITYHVMLAIFLLACAAPAPSPTPQPFAQFILPTRDPNATTATPFQPAGKTETPIPTYTASPFPSVTFTPTTQPTVTLTSAPSAPIPAATTQSAPPPLPSTSSRPNYILFATLDFANKTITVDQTIRYYNTTGTALSDLVFSVQPNLYTNAFKLNSIAQDGTALTSYSFSGQRLSVNLNQPIPNGSAVTITLNFTLKIPQKGAGDVFGYDFNQINLVNWYPFIVPNRGGWLLYDPMPWGEHLVYDASDVELNIKTESGVVLAVGASPEANGEWTRYRMYGARTVSISASNEFIVNETTVGNVVIRSYYFSGYQKGGDDLLIYASEAIQTYSAEFAPYPHQALAIVQSDMDDGMEYDGLVFLSTDFYSQYTGSARSNLTTIGVHEIAHQWWYSLVGSDHAMQPWLDEALATYSERIFYENNYPANISWWWQFRVNYFKPSGYVDGSIYDYDSFRSYTNAVYFRGALFMDDLRELMGYGNFSKFIKAYATRYANGHATSADFFALARETINVNYDNLIEEYFSGSY